MVQRAIARGTRWNASPQPSVISQLIQEGKARAKVLRSTDKWYGVTYQADKPVVVAAIAEKTAAGIYPDHLWAKG